MNSKSVTLKFQIEDHPRIPNAVELVRVYEDGQRFSLGVFIEPTIEESRKKAAQQYRKMTADLGRKNV